jgi:hypothetical protein
LASSQGTSFPFIQIFSDLPGKDMRSLCLLFA